MWIDLYVLAALSVAVAVWLISPRFQSYDPPGDIARGFWSAVAGALWPLLLVGAAQVYAVHYIVRRFRPAYSAKLDLAPRAALQDVSLRP
ncbi:hypothetical protein [Mycolicibacterium sarraceniae]|uniref:Uncharacterized protein n=1 Tax=Mycolicibacterium sarraceniae TaxID=1534348 RepID=A0A7I7SMH2_9MYCO|nr:hypothetical protein [Mycolicibacterium sarraceniae]BBY58187.1 hypothetical protein MSAR_13230 [Mycolicibacterium sarraceniae]